VGHHGGVLRLADYLPAIPGDAAELAVSSPLERFLAWSEERGIRLYPHQEEALLDAMLRSAPISPLCARAGGRITPLP
jgi:hypothetical protein